MIIIRNYNPNADYPSIEKLYKDSSTFGGQFDPARDSEERLKSLSAQKPDAVLVAEANSEIIGTLTLFGDDRSMWLYRFAVRDQNIEVSKMLWNKAKETCKKLGHEQVLVYAPEGDKGFEDRYSRLGFTKGGNFTAYWQNLN